MLTEISDFRFGESVASVFDDMLDRSVPFYHEIQRMIGEMAADFAVEGTNCYDLGCSTGTTMLHLDKCVSDQVRFIGVDNSAEMLDRCRTKLAQHGFTRAHELRCADLNQGARHYPGGQARLRPPSTCRWMWNTDCPASALVLNTVR